MFLDFRLDFEENGKSLLKKVNKTVALLNKFQNILPRSALLTTYKCFVRTHLDYGDIIYDQAFSNSFHQKIESLQYNTLNIFKSKILKFIRPAANSIFGCHDPIGVKLLTRLRLGLSHPCEHKFKHSFQDTQSTLQLWERS